MATPEKRTTDVRIVCEMPRHICRNIGFGYGTDLYWEYIEKECNRWVRDFHDFIRDHRSQDPVVLDVERVTETVCSECGDKWEPGDIDGKQCCMSCGEEVEAKAKEEQR
jgi:hypothetical protein